MQVWLVQIKYGVTSEANLSVVTIVLLLPALRDSRRLTGIELQAESLCKKILPANYKWKSAEAIRNALLEKKTYAEVSYNVINIMFQQYIKTY